MRWTHLLLFLALLGCHSAPAAEPAPAHSELYVFSKVDEWLAHAWSDGVQAAAPLARQIESFGVQALPALRWNLIDVRTRYDATERAEIAVELSRLADLAGMHWTAQGVAQVPQWMQGRWANDAYDYRFTDREWLWTRKVGVARQEYPTRLMRVVAVDDDRVEVEVVSFGTLILYREGPMLVAEMMVRGELKRERLFPR